MPGFWETLNQNLSGVFEDRERLKEQKRLRALQKMKFLMESGDVGTPVSPDMAQEVADYAPEGSGMIKDGAYTGTPEQQRMFEFRQWMEQNPQADPDSMMTRGVSSGAVSPNAYSNYINSVEARKSREQIAEENRQSREEIARMNNDTRLDLASLRRSMSGGDTGSYDGLFENKAQRQKWAANRKTYSPYGGPYNYITQRLLNDPETAKATLAEDLQMSPDDIDLNQLDPWSKYYSHLSGNVNTVRDKYGMKPEEVEALLTHVKKIAAKRYKNGTDQ